jgi:hypothetical protein
MYSNYLDNPQNVDIDYQMNIAMKIEYIYRQDALQGIYDDNSVKAVLGKRIIWTRS